MKKAHLSFCTDIQKSCLDIGLMHLIRGKYRDGQRNKDKNQNRDFFQ